MLPQVGLAHGFGSRLYFRRLAQPHSTEQNRCSLWIEENPFPQPSRAQVPVIIRYYQLQPASYRAIVL